MHKIIAPLMSVLVSLFPSLAFAGSIEELLTQNHVVLIVNHCGRGVLDCKKIEYFGANRKTGTSIHMYGQSIVTGGAGDWLGYQFRNGKTEYFVYVNGDSVTLTIEQNRKTLTEEKGLLTRYGGFE